MADARVALLWRVPTAGYRWCEASFRGAGGQWKETPARVLVPKTEEWDQYEPRQDVPSLFRRLAELEFPEDVSAREDQVQQFADTYGALGVGSVVRLPDGRTTVGETLPMWWEAWDLMRAALAVWDALRTEDTEALQRWVTCTEANGRRQGVVTPDAPWVSAIMQAIGQPVRDKAVADAARWLEPSYMTGPTDGSHSPSGPVLWALLYLRTMVNLQLESYTRLRLQYVPSSPEKAPLQLRIVPIHLLGEMWLQLAEVIEGELRYERCATCGRWFPVKPKGNRPSTRFCQPYCRVKGNRQARKARAAVKR